MVRIYRNSISFRNINLITVINTYIIETYNLMASTYVSIKIKLKDGRLNKKDKEGQLAMMSIIFVRKLQI